MRRTRVFSRSKPPPSPPVPLAGRAGFSQKTQEQSSASRGPTTGSNLTLSAARHNRSAQCSMQQDDDPCSDTSRMTSDYARPSGKSCGHQKTRVSRNKVIYRSSVHTIDQAHQETVQPNMSTPRTTHVGRFDRSVRQPALDIGDNTEEIAIMGRENMIDNEQETFSTVNIELKKSPESIPDNEADASRKAECTKNRNIYDIHTQDVVHWDDFTVSKGRGGPVESTFTEKQRKSRPLRRVERKITRKTGVTEADKCSIRRQNITHHGPGMYFLRVLRETQNSHRDTAQGITSQNKLMANGADNEHSRKDDDRKLGVDHGDCEGVIIETTSDRTDDNTELFASDNRDAPTVSAQFNCEADSSDVDISYSSEDDASDACSSVESSVTARANNSCNNLELTMDTALSSGPEMAPVTTQHTIDADMATSLSETTPKPASKRKKRRRSKRTSSTSSLSSQTTSPNPSFSAAADPSMSACASASILPQTDTDSGIDLGSQSSLPSSISCPSLDQTLDSRSSSAERLRRCSSPSFTYDPEVASQIPFYFTEPLVEEYELVSGGVSDVLFSLCVGDETADTDSGKDDTQSNCSWTEFDEEICSPLSDTEDTSSPEHSVYDSSTAPLCGHVCVPEDETRLATEEISRDCTRAVAGDAVGLPEDYEVDYDSYLPAHVLMHVKRDLVSVLMEYGQTREVKVSFKDMERSGPHHASRFHTAAIVDGETFPMGSGSSKKNAKKAAAAQALKIMYDRGRKNLEVVNEVAHKKLKAMSEEEVGSHAHRVVMVSRHVLDTAEETQFINYSKDKIAATFVLEYHGKMRVVGLGTGNRCILYQHLTLDGKRIIHSHAEIIARRAFMRYLYKQLLTYNGNRSHPIFTRSDTGKLKLRDKIQVHLYISRPPCGDAAAFPTISNFPNKMRAIRKQGQLRTIIDDGEGAIPTDFPVPAGANGKERLRIMTCSDKICRWNVLGVQGALLSHFLDPIYINSLVIGSHTGDQRGHVPRAVSGRLKCGRLHEVIQRPYRINTPDIHYPHDDLADNYNITKSKQYCITWSYGDIDAEVIDAITGVTNMETMEEVIPSRVAKLTMHRLFQQVCKRYGRNDIADLDYLKAKRSSTTFQRMKSFVGQHLAAMGFGQWYSLQDTYGTDSMNCPGPC